MLTQYSGFHKKSLNWSESGAQQLSSDMQMQLWDGSCEPEAANHEGDDPCRDCTARFDARALAEQLASAYWNCNKSRSLLHISGKNYIDSILQDKICKLEGAYSPAHYGGHMKWESDTTAVKGSSRKKVKGERGAVKQINDSAGIFQTFCPIGTLQHIIVTLEGCAPHLNRYQLHGQQVVWLQLD
ncbi:hypothetical protein CPB85DRAFT_1260371 [Mucidula mucida]|nr:hypothetical protein CPB85DRAFT_1260371 [Mucidula mucida]